jgi:hypothetical protein
MFSVSSYFQSLLQRNDNGIMIRPCPFSGTGPASVTLMYSVSRSASTISASFARLGATHHLEVQRLAAHRVIEALIAGHAAFADRVIKNLALSVVAVTS